MPQEQRADPRSLDLPVDAETSLQRGMRLCTWGSALAGVMFRAELGQAASSGLLSQPKPWDAALELAFPCCCGSLGAGCGNGPAVCAV